jgi:lauroyl/myristoyl acyltransferase
MIDSLKDFAYASGWQFVQYLPEKQARRLFETFGEKAWQKDGRSVQRLRANLDRATRFALPNSELEDLTRETLRNYSRYWCDVFRMPKWNSQMVQERTQAFAAQPLYDALDSGRPIVAALPHMGNWDLCGLWFTQQFRPISSVAERLNPASLFERFVEFRKSLGIEIFAHHSTPDVYQRLIEALKKGRLVALVADRDLSKLGVDVDFFGAPTKMPAGPAALTIDTDAVLLPVSLWHKGEIVYGQPFEPIQVPASGDRAAKISQMTQQLARNFESAISAHPSDWYMLQRVWADPLLPRGGARLHR